MRKGLYVGIDPGMKGAIAALWHLGRKGSHVHSIDDIPTTTDSGKRVLDIDELRELIAGLHRRAMLEGVGTAWVIEMQQGFPNQSCTSVFTTGMNYGIIRGILGGRRLKHVHQVRPKVWRKSLGLAGDKMFSRVRAEQMFPKAADMLGKRNTEDRSEALLLAYYAKEIWGGTPF